MVFEIEDRSEYKRKMKELLQIDACTTAIVTVDLQNEYLDPAIGAAPCSPEECERVISHSHRLHDFSRRHGMPVIHAYVKRRPLDSEPRFGICAYVDASHRAGISQNPRRGARVAPDRVEGMAQAELPEGLAAPGDIHVTTKRVMDSFHGTDLDMLLTRVFKTQTVVITGINTDTCVYATTFAASNRGYQPVVISDCVASHRGLDHHRMALELMSRSMAWVLTVDEFQAKVLQGAQVRASAQA